MKDSFYFPHDYHARHDPKLAALIKMHGMVGYGTWWNLIEILHEQGGRIEKFPKLIEGLAHDFKQNEATLQVLLSCFINDLNLLKEDETHIWSERVLQNFKEREGKRLQKAESGRLGGIISGQKRSETKHTSSTIEANEAKERKGKERKVKSKAPISDEDFFKALKANPAYKHIDVENELSKMDGYLLTKRGRQKTRRFVVAWLNRIDKPLGSTQSKLSQGEDTLAKYKLMMSEAV